MGFVEVISPLIAVLVSGCALLASMGNLTVTARLKRDEALFRELSKNQTEVSEGPVSDIHRAIVGKLLSYYVVPTHLFISPIFFALFFLAISALVGLDAAYIEQTQWMSVVYDNIAFLLLVIIGSMCSVYLVVELLYRRKLVLSDFVSKRKQVDLDHSLFAMLMSSRNYSEVAWVVWVAIFALASNLAVGAIANIIVRYSQRELSPLVGVQYVIAVALIVCIICVFFFSKMIAGAKSGAVDETSGNVSKNAVHQKDTESSSDMNR